MLRHHRGQQPPMFGTECRITCISRRSLNSASRDGTMHDRCRASRPCRCCVACDMRLASDRPATVRARQRAAQTKTSFNRVQRASSSGPSRQSSAPLASCISQDCRLFRSSAAEDRPNPVFLGPARRTDWLIRHPTTPFHHINPLTPPPQHPDTQHDREQEQGKKITETEKQP